MASSKKRTKVLSKAPVVVIGSWYEYQNQDGTIYWTSPTRFHVAVHGSVEEFAPLKTCPSCSQEGGYVHQAGSEEAGSLCQWCSWFWEDDETSQVVTGKSPIV